MISPTGWPASDGRAASSQVTSDGTLSKEYGAEAFFRAFRWAICAITQEREMTAWAFRNSGEAVAFISEEMTLRR